MSISNRWAWNYAKGPLGRKVISYDPQRKVMVESYPRLKVEQLFTMKQMSYRVKTRLRLTAMSTLCSL